jgi:hypothetical protein
MGKSVNIPTSMIAPCGMNCALCMGYQRKKNHCAGCNSLNQTRVKCVIKYCEYLKDSGKKFCFGCKKYPCKRLTALDKRYRTKYGMSMIENLNSIKEAGIRKFIKDEKEKWACKECGSLICVHKKRCLTCAP